jgi:hypothetical protein
MDPLTFETDDDPSLEQLRREVVEHRQAARVHFEFRSWRGGDGTSKADIASAFVQRLGLRPPEAWTPLSAPEALEAATRVLHSDLVYDLPVMKRDLAKELARRFIECFEDGAAFVTNGTFALDRTGGGWSPLTDATFDSGVIGVSTERIGLLWVEDED